MFHQGLNPSPIRRLFVIVISLTAFLVIAIGYFYSDNHYADELILKHKISNPDEVFQFVINQKVQAPPGSPVHQGQSFRSLMSTEKNWLWCDEGAIAIAVLSQRLGYETRLVDLLHKRTGKSHHTIVEVKVNNHWRAYDFTGRRIIPDPRLSADYPSVPRYRVYPEAKHLLLLNNSFLRSASYACQSMR